MFLTLVHLNLGVALHRLLGRHPFVLILKFIDQEIE